LIQQVYGIDEYHLLGGPGWIGSDQYEIQAEAPAPVGRDQMVLMIQTLLADRFHLVMHKETRQLTTYLLLVAQGGPKLKPAASNDGPEGGIAIMARGMISARKVTMDHVAEWLSSPRQLGGVRHQNAVLAEYPHLGLVLRLYMP
jgi:uncharacterized protein (TIGR03435 family)